MEFQYKVNLSPRAQETALPLLFVARMLVIFLIWIMGKDTMSLPFLPFIESIDSLRGFPTLFKLLDWLYWISMVMVFAGIRLRTFSLILGCLIFFSILGSKLQFSNSLLYSGGIFFLIGLYKPGLEWIFNVQIALLYLGAGLNKLLDPDWISGHYFDFFFTEPYPNQLYLSLSKQLPSMLLATLVSFYYYFSRVVTWDLGFDWEKATAASVLNSWISFINVITHFRCPFLYILLLNGC
jgi:hypothetical protein